jgi:hypothetical protein
LNIISNTNSKVDILLVDALSFNFWALHQFFKGDADGHLQHQSKRQNYKYSLKETEGFHWNKFGFLRFC